MNALKTHGIMVAACIGFFALGLITAAFGPALPNLAANTETDLATVGSVITGLFFGSLVALIVAGPLNDRLGQRPMLLLGGALLLLGISGVILSPSLPLLLICAVVSGLGHGAMDITTNVLIAEVYARRSVTALNLLNVFFGVGAVVGPAIASLTLRWWGSALPALWIGVGLLGIQLLLIPLLVHNPPALSTKTAEISPASLLRSPALWLFGLLILFYVGTENGIANWTPAYLERTTTLSAATAALITSGFWLALTGGRVIAAVLGSYLASNTLLFATLVGSLGAGALLAISTGNAGVTITAVLLMGFFFGPIFPTTIAITTATFRQSPGTAASTVVAMGSGGGMLIPWIQGILLERVSPATSVLFVAAGAAAMLALHLGRGAMMPKPAYES